MKSADLIEVEVWVKIDDEENKTVAFDRAECAEEWNEEFTDEGQPCRMIRATIMMARPRAVEVKATIPDESTEAAVTVS